MTQFEVGKRYKTRGGSIAEVIQIIDSQGDPWPMDVLIIDPPENPRRREWLSLGGCAEYDGDDNSDSLLLPAIEPEGEPAGLSKPATDCFMSIRDAWDDFHRGVLHGKLHPSYGGVAVCGKMGLVIGCTYPDKDTALAQSSAVIAAIDRLLEGQSHD